MYIIIITILLFYITYLKYFKIKNKFWCNQPVFFYHNLFYWFSQNRKITNEKLPITQYFNNKIELYPLKNKKDYNFLKCVNLIKNDYLNFKNNVYKPKLRDIFSYFKFNKNSFYSILENYNNTISCLTSRELKIYRKQKEELIVNYIDFLCTEKSYRKQNITPEVIYTSLVKINDLTNNNIFLFKREGYGNNFVHITKYKSFIFLMKEYKSSLIRSKIKNINNIKLISELNFHKFFDFYVYDNDKNMNYLIKNKIINIYGVYKKDEIIGIYFFRDSKQFIDDNKVMECFGSILINNNYKELFINGFIDILKMLNKNNNMKYILLENISYNYLFLNKLKLFKNIGTIDYYYYFYNYIMAPINSKKCLILN